MASFELAIDTVLKHEGGFVNDPDDPGGATNYGISLRAAIEDPAIDVDVDHDGDEDVEDMKNLSLAQTKEIYRLRYWRYNDVLSQAVATWLFDFGVNTGPKRACRVLQQALRELDSPVEVDGEFGPETLYYTNLTEESDLLPELRAQAAAYYCRIVAYAPKRRKFLVGWLKRIGVL